MFPSSCLKNLWIFSEDSVFPMDHCVFSLFPYTLGLRVELSVLFMPHLQFQIILSSFSLKCSSFEPHHQILPHTTPSHSQLLSLLASSFIKYFKTEMFTFSSNSPCFLIHKSIWHFKFSVFSVVDFCVILYYMPCLLCHENCSYCPFSMCYQDGGVAVD